MRFIFPRNLKMRRPERFAKVIGALCLAFLATGCSLDGASKRVAADTPRGETPPRTSLPMPPVAATRRTGSFDKGWMLLDGRRATLSDYRGQAVVLDFYATYCPPCRDEIPHLIALQRRYGPEGLNIIGLNVGDEADRVKVPQFVQELGIQYPLGNPDRELVELFFSGNSAIPQTYVFDRKGRLVKRFIGYDASVPAELESAVQTALVAD